MIAYGFHGCMDNVKLDLFNVFQKCRHEMDQNDDNHALKLIIAYIIGLLHSHSINQ